MRQLRICRIQNRIPETDSTHCVAKPDVICLCKITQCGVIDMDIARTIKELRESTGMTRKAFSEHTGIPVRTLEDWEAGRRRPPEYIPRLIAYQLKYEELSGEKKCSDCLSDKL